MEAFLKALQLGDYDEFLSAMEESLQVRKEHLNRQHSDNPIVKRLTLCHVWEEEQCCSKYMPDVTAYCYTFKTPSGKEVGIRYFEMSAKHEYVRGCTITFGTSVQNLIYGDNVAYIRFNQAETGSPVEEILKDLQLSCSFTNAKLVLDALYGQEQHFEDFYNLLGDDWEPEEKRSKVDDDDDEKQ
jgi:hypothetical protein